MPLVIPVFIPHWGCPHHCLFCNQERISGVGKDKASPGDVAGIIDLWLARSPGRAEVQVAFFGGSFTCLPTGEQVAMLAAVQPYIAAGKVDCIRLSTRPDCIDPAVCRLLREFRVGVVELGVQSFNDDVLHENRRGHDAAQCRSALTLLKEAGMRVGLQLMPGLPGESGRSFLRGIAEAARLKPDFIRLYPVVVVAGSGLEERFRQNRYRPLSLNRAIALTARAWTLLHQAGIPVVRMGLQPSESLTRSYVAGPYHPAFGELVLARLWLKRIRARLALLRPGESLNIHISQRDQSAVSGMKRANIKRLEELGFSGRFTILPDKNRARGSIAYSCPERLLNPSKSLELVRGEIMRENILSLDDVLGILRKRKADFAVAYGVTEIGIFGSFARGEAKPDSDVDVVVKMEKPDLFSMVHIKESLEEDLHCPVDIIRFRERMNPFLKSRIEKEAVYA